MVFGRLIKDKYAWHPVFAWLPVYLIDGRWAWLQQVERISYYANEIPGSALVSLCGWCYRVPEEA